LGIRQGEAQQTASRGTTDTVGVAERVRRRSGDDRDVDMHLAVLNGLVTAAMGAQDGHAVHFAL